MDRDPLTARARLAGDPFRPRYHFVPPGGYLGDPNGTFFWEGEYHLFYQYNPYEAVDANMHWGHAKSTDLIHWTDLPIALAPSLDGPDRRGCYSGHAVEGADAPTLLYYGNPDGHCLATSSDGLITWDKHPANSVIPHPSDPAAGWRPWDPFAWRDGDTWYALSGGRIEGAGDTAFLCESSDLIHWRYLHPLYVGGREHPPESDCSVPNFFPLGDKHVLLFASHERGVQYYLGPFAQRRFHPERHARMNFGEFGLATGHLCAGITFPDSANRRVFFGWIPEGRYETAQAASGWAGVMTLPRVLSLGSHGLLDIEPAPELHALRGASRRIDDLRVPAGRVVPLEGLGGGGFELSAVIEPCHARRVGVMLRGSPEEREQTRIVYEPAAKTLVLDAEASSLRPDVVGRGAQRAPLELAAGEPLRLRLFFDRSVVEVFANGRQCLTKRIYPTRPENLGVALVAEGGDAHAASIESWEMADVW